MTEGNRTLKLLTTSTAALLAAAALWAAPATAMTEKPTEPGPTTSSGSPGGATAVPEPGVVALFGMGVLALGLRKRRRKSR